jgi:diguanylate cyclase (GGDEF)-like protein
MYIRQISERDRDRLPEEGREFVSNFMDLSTGVFHEEAFRHLLAQEVVRATRYRDFFSVCLVRPDLSDGQQVSEEIERTMSRKVRDLVRATDVVGRLSSAIGIIFLNTAGKDAFHIAERIQWNIEQVAFWEGHRARRLAVSVGVVSFPRDGHTAAGLLSLAQARLAQAVRQGGNGVSYTIGTLD